MSEEQAAPKRTASKSKRTFVSSSPLLTLQYMCTTIQSSPHQYIYVNGYNLRMSNHKSAHTPPIAY